MGSRKGSFGGFGASAAAASFGSTQQAAFGALAPPASRASFEAGNREWSSLPSPPSGSSMMGLPASASFSTEVDSTTQVAWEDVTSCQSADGSFPPSPTLTALLHLATNTIEWNTCLVVAWLEERRPNHKEEWGLVTEKALRWLKTGGHLPALLDAARMVVRGERCTQGHHLSLIARQAGELWHCDAIGGCAHSASRDGDHFGVESLRCSEDESEAGWRL